MALALALALLAQASDRTLDVGSAKRTYVLHVGRDAKGPMPLVLQLHGAGGNGRGQQGLCRMDALADRHGFAVAYPDGEGRFWRYNGGPDIAFLKALIEALVKEGVADRRRVYVAGMSNGSIMAQMVAIEMGDRVAAVAGVGAMPSKSVIARARPRRAVPVLYLHGTEDRIVGYDGALSDGRQGFLPTAEEMIRWWASKNGCKPDPKIEALPDTDDGTTVRRWTFEGGAETVFYSIEGGGHTWPGGPPMGEAMGRVSRDVDATAVMWEFFSRHALPK